MENIIKYISTNQIISGGTPDPDCAGLLSERLRAISTNPLAFGTLGGNIELCGVHGL